jgi:hypothetical protein
MKIMLENLIADAFFEFFELVSEYLFMFLILYNSLCFNLS